jgi:hypothetical protein
LLLEDANLVDQVGPLIQELQQFRIDLVNSAANLFQ